MEKFITIYLKLILRRLYIGEHFNFYDLYIIHALESLVGNLPTVKGMLDGLKTVFEVEDYLFKLSQASILTGEIARWNEARSACFIFFWRCIDVAEFVTSPDAKPAIERLKFLHHTYKGLTELNYYDMSGTMTNFLQDCEIPVNREAILFLSSAMLIDLQHYINKIKEANDSFKSIYHERSIGKEHVARMGKLSKVRFKVDAALDALIDSVNVAWAANEMGANDPDVRQQLIEVREAITAAVRQVQLNITHRGFHRKKKDDKEDAETQTPDNQNPPAPDTPPASRDSSQG